MILEVKMLESKDYITFCVSGIAIAISIISLIISWQQKNNDTKRTIRKNLTDTLESINEMNIKMALLRQNKETYQSNEVRELRRLYNSQKRVLLAHANYLATEHDGLITDIDCSIIAGTYSVQGNGVMASSY